MLPTLQAGYITSLLEAAILIEDPDTGIIQLTPEGYAVLHKPLPKVFDQKAARERLEKLVKDYLEIWPPKIMSGNRLVKQGPGAIRSKFTTFLRKYPKFTDAEILEVTRLYVDKLKRKNYEFMTCSDYFIEKDRVSQLESYIIALQQHKNAQAAGIAPLEVKSIHERTL